MAKITTSRQLSSLLQPLGIELVRYHTKHFNWGLKYSSTDDKVGIALYVGSKISRFFWLNIKDLILDICHKDSGNFVIESSAKSYDVLCRNPYIMCNSLEEAKIVKDLLL